MWTKITLSELSTAIYNKYDVPLYHSCFFCKCDKATVHLSRTSEDTGYTYHDSICRVCAKKWNPTE